MSIEKILIYFLVFFGLTISQAQNIPMRSNISTPYGKVPITTHYVRIPNGNGNNYNNNSSGAPEIKSYKYFYEITLQNDSVVKKLSKIDIKDSVHSITVKVSGEQKKIHPKDTKYIYTEDAGKKYTGVPNDSCWLFKIVSGNINCYAFLPVLSSAYIVAIQLGEEGAIKAFNKDNLIQIVANNEEALNYAKKDRLLESIKLFNKGK